MGCRFVDGNGSMHQWLYELKLECECTDGSNEICSGLQHMQSSSPDRPDEIWIEAVNQSIEKLRIKKKVLKKVTKITYTCIRGGYV